MPFRKRLCFAEVKKIQRKMTFSNQHFLSTKRIQFDSKSYKKCQKNKDFVHDEYGTCMMQFVEDDIPERGF